MAVQAFGKHALAKRNRLGLLHLIDAGPNPVPFRRFDDERGPFLVEAVGVQVEPAPLGLLEVEGECVQLFAATEPDEPIVARLYVRFENLLVLLARDRGCAIRGDHQVVVHGVVIGIGDLGLEEQLDAQSGRPLLKYVQQLETGDPAKPVTTGCNFSALEMDVNVVPVAKGMSNFGMGFWIYALEAVHGLVGEDNAPAKRGVSVVALDDSDLPAGVGLLQENSQVQPGRPAA